MSTRAGARRVGSCAVAIAALAALVSAQAPTAPGIGVRLSDVTVAAGLRVTHQNGAAGKKYLPETMGSGSAFADVDADGDQDLILVSGVWPAAGTTGPFARVFANDGTGRFTDVTATAGLQGAGDPAVAGLAYGMGIAAADYDNDGAADVLLTSVGGVRLFRNAGKGRFTEVTAKAGLAGRRAFSTSAMWFDYDKDGRLDLIVCNYVQWSPETDIFCSVDGKAKSYCTPEAYRGSTSWLYRNKGDGAFEDVTAKAGLFDATSKSLGVTLLDYDQDGWPDVFVANDTQPNKLYRNNRNGTFTELGLKAGVAFSEEGRARAGMGVDAADLDGSGRPAVAVTNFSGEMLGLFRADATGLYQDSAPRSDVGRATRQTLGWGCFFFDVDLDGQQDLLHNVDGRFVDVARAVGDAFAQPKMGRGAAFADVDGDGDLDTVVTTNGGPVHLYRTDLQAPHRSVRLRLVGTVSNRDGIGARVTTRVGKASASRIVRTGSSYLSQSELPLTFGLGTAGRAEDVTVQWPSGRRDHLAALDAGIEYTVAEGKGITGKRTWGTSPAGRR